MAARRGRAGAGRNRPAPAARDQPGAARDQPGAARDPGSAARDHCIRLLSVRPRTRAELDTALRRRGFDADVIADVLARYSDVGMIDDEAFARAWVTSRHHSKGLARRALAGELRRKGVADEDVGLALDELGSDTEAATARALVERRLRTERAAAQRSTARRAAAAGAGELGENEPGDQDSRQREQAALMRKLIGVLARKGYPPGLAFRVVKEVVQETVDCDVAELLDPDPYVEDLDDFDQLRS
jgi:regulatory protein